MLLVNSHGSCCCPYDDMTVSMHMPRNMVTLCITKIMKLRKRICRHRPHNCCHKEHTHCDLTTKTGCEWHPKLPLYHNMETIAMIVLTETSTQRWKNTRTRASATTTANLTATAHKCATTSDPASSEAALQLRCHPRLKGAMNRSNRIRIRMHKPPLRTYVEPCMFWHPVGCTTWGRHDFGHVVMTILKNIRGLSPVIQTVIVQYSNGIWCNIQTVILQYSNGNFAIFKR